MEYLDSATVKHRIAGKPVETDVLLDLAIQIAEGLDAAHAEGDFIFRVLMSGTVCPPCQVFNRAESSRTAKDWANNACGKL
jgi:hypothetical protein